LQRLFVAWQIPVKVILDNGSSMPGEEILLRALYEFVSGEDQYNIATNVFGREQSAQARSFKWFVSHMYDNFNYLLTNNLDWWNESGYWHQSMEALKIKFGGNQLFTTACFIDCNCLKLFKARGRAMF
jgi:hypothetical protein